MSDSDTIRPTKKQRDILLFVESFIVEHGYSPSYREIMKGLRYTSVATVSLHVNSLIDRGHLIKRGNSARSLEVAKTSAETKKITTNQISASQEKWLIKQVDYHFAQIEQEKRPSSQSLDSLFVLVGALKVLGLDGAVQSFIPRISALKQKTINPADK